MRKNFKTLMGIVMALVMSFSFGGMTVCAAPKNAEDILPDAPGGVYYLWKTYLSRDITAATAKVDNVLGQITSASMTDLDKVDAVSGWMINNLTYDYNNYINGDVSGRDVSVISVLADGIGNDEGYAAVFDMFMYRAGIPSARVIGVADGYKHTWNMVYLEGNWYYIDVSWMDAGRPYNSAMYGLPTDISGPEYAELRQRLAEAESSYSQSAATEYDLTNVKTGWRDHEAVYCEVTAIVDSITELNEAG